MASAVDLLFLIHFAIVFRNRAGDLFLVARGFLSAAATRVSDAPNGVGTVISD